MEPALTSRRLRDGALVLALVLGSYAGALGVLRRTEFTLDDDALVEHDARLDVRGWADAWRLVSSGYWGETYAAERLWRPVPTVSFALDRALWGPSPDGYHRTNIALHAATSLLVLALLRRVTRSGRLALVGASLFAVHSIHAEAVAGVVGRCEVLGLLGALGGMLLHLRARGGRAGLYPAAALCFLLGFASKEIALTGPFVLALVEVALRGPGRAARPSAAWLAPYALYGLSIVGYFLLRGLALSGGEGGALDALFPTASARTLGALSLTERVAVALLTARDALVAGLLPGRTSAHYPLPFPVSAGPPGWSNPALLATALLHLLLLGAGAWALSRPGPASRSAGLGVWGFYLSLGPVSNLIPIGVVFADRLLYTPSLWSCLALTSAAAPLVRRRGALSVALLLALGAHGLFLSGNVRAWTSDLLLWQTSHERFPDSPRCQAALGFQWLNRGRVDLARPLFERAIEGFSPPERWPRYAAQARAGLALTLPPADLSRARALLEEAAALDEGQQEVALGLTQVYLLLAERAVDPEEAAAYLRSAERAARQGTRGAPHSYDLWLRLGTVLSRTPGREAEAEEAYARAIERRPAPWQACTNRALLRQRRGDLSGALEDQRVVVETLSVMTPLGAQEQEVLAQALLLRGALAAKLGLEDEARRSWDELRRRFPQRLTAEQHAQLLSELR